MDTDAGSYDTLRSTHPGRLVALNRTSAAPAVSQAATNFTSWLITNDRNPADDFAW
jgi:hypothetical protein